MNCFFVDNSIQSRVEIIGKQMEKLLKISNQRANSRLSMRKLQYIFLFSWLDQICCQQSNHLKVKCNFQFSIIKPSFSKI